MRYLIIVLVSLCLVSCNKDDDSPQDPDSVSQLPPITMTGEPFVVTNTNEMVAIFQQGQLQFGASGINFNLNDPLNINLSYNLIGNSRYQVDSNPQLGCQYQFQDTYQGTIIFTKIDRTNYVISGTFEFSTITQGCDNIDITQGRFDLQYIP